MKVLRTSCHSLGLDLQISASVVTIGNFDGCHRGHQELIKLTRHWADSWNISSVVLSFDPNPKEFFQPERALGRLFQLNQKIRALDELSISALVIQKFDQDFSLMEPYEFYQSLLKKALKARAVVVGHDFRFGAKRQGDVDLLRKLASEDGVTVHVVGQQVDNDGEAISSSFIRKLLEERALDRANSMLGRPYMLEGVIVKGFQLGRKLGFPTANLDCGQQLLPGFGVYAGFARVGGDAPIFKAAADSVPCILNIGKKPTLDQQTVKPTVEVHLLEGTYGPDALYDQILSVSLAHFVRTEQKFPSLDALKAQIGADCEEARRLLSNTPAISPSIKAGGFQKGS